MGDDLSGQHGISPCATSIDIDMVDPARAANACANGVETRLATTSAANTREMKFDRFTPEEWHGWREVESKRTVTNPTTITRFPSSASSVLV